MGAWWKWTSCGSAASSLAPTFLRCRPPPSLSLFSSILPTPLSPPISVSPNLSPCSAVTPPSNAVIPELPCALPLLSRFAAGQRSALEGSSYSAVAAKLEGGLDSPRQRHPRGGGAPSPSSTGGRQISSELWEPPMTDEVGPRRFGSSGSSAGPWRSSSSPQHLHLPRLLADPAQVLGRAPGRPRHHAEVQIWPRRPWSGEQGGAGEPFPVVPPPPRTTLVSITTRRRRCGRCCRS